MSELCRMELTDVRDFLSGIHDEISTPVLQKAQFVLEQLIEIGVGYLSLERPVSTLSGGESQRVKMARQLDCNLVDMLYVLDEPSIGLHPRDTQKLISILYRLRDKGNSVFVVEHDPDIIRAAEWLIDMGPKAGKYGGNVVYAGEPEGIHKIRQQAATETPDETLLHMDEIWEEEAVSFMGAGDGCQTKAATVSPITITLRDQFLKSQNRSL
jgi:excinuclease UvrABC ATPase subunit